MMTPDPAHALFDLITAHRITASIYVAARLGVADRLAEAPRTVAELATMVGAHENSLGRLLGALVTFGICTQDNAKRFQLTAIGMHLSGRCRQVTQGVGNLRRRDAVAVVGWLFGVHSNWQDPR